MAFCVASPRPSAPAYQRAPGIRRPGSLFHLIDTGPFKLVVLRPTDSIKAHPAIPICETGRPYLDGIEYMILSAMGAFDPFPGRFAAAHRDW
jgi:hypothetical protein